MCLTFAVLPPPVQHQRPPAVPLTRVLVLHSPGTQHVVSDVILTQGRLAPGHRDHRHLMDQPDHFMQLIDQSGLTLTSCSISARKEEPSLVTPQPATVIGLFSLIPEKEEDQGNAEEAIKYPRHLEKAGKWSGSGEGLQGSLVSRARCRCRRSL